MAWSRQIKSTNTNMYTETGSQWETPLTDTVVPLLLVPLWAFIEVTCLQYKPQTSKIKENRWLKTVCHLWTIHWDKFCPPLHTNSFQWTYLNSTCMEFLIHHLTIMVILYLLDKDTSLIKQEVKNKTKRVNLVHSLWKQLSFSCF